MSRKQTLYLTPESVVVVFSVLLGEPHQRHSRPKGCGQANSGKKDTCDQIHTCTTISTSKVFTPCFFREVGSKDAGLDPALQNLSMEDLYRMLALLDLVEESGVNYDEKISPKDLKTLGYLVEQYT